ncbi:MULTISPECIES: hypothetical protein [unclassified Streptomyces]|nr:MULTISPECIES: hypothetical protein [unclassified Streptomyces]
MSLFVIGISLAAGLAGAEASANRARTAATAGTAPPPYCHHAPSAHLRHVR